MPPRVFPVTRAVGEKARPKYGPETKEAACDASKRPKSREETPKEGIGDNRVAAPQ